MSSSPSAPTNVLLSAEAVLSPKHVTSALLLALGAGAVNAGAFAVCDRFVTHVTGNLTRIGVDVGQWWLVLEYVLVLASFVLGAMASVLAIQGRTISGKRPLHAAPLLGAVGLITATALLGAAGAFGAPGGAAEETADFVFMCALAFAMGLMNAGVASSTALAVRTTHMTGPATDFGVSLATAWLSSGESRRHALRLAGLRGGKVLAFAAGAALMFPLVRAVGFLAFVAPAAVLTFATLQSFMPHRDDAARRGRVPHLASGSARSCP